MARRSSNNNQGCGTILLGLLCIGMIGSIVSALKTGLLYIVAGFGRSIPFLVLALLVIAFLNIIFNITHKTPITYDQARKLAKYYAQAYIRKTYIFKKGALPVDPYFKSNMNATGMWYDIEVPLCTFPAYISSLLKGKQHEWVVLAIEKDGIVYNMWVNKGMNNQQVAFNCDLKDVIQKSLNIGGYSILRFHNHPNSDPTHYTTLVASEQDKISAASCAEYVNNSGLNWFDFVCARGDFLLFYSKISDTFEVNGSSTSDIVDRIGITPEMNLQLQREYHNHCGIRKILKSKIFIISVALCLIISFYYTGKGTVALPGVKFEPTQDYLISTLSSVPGIEEVEAVTLETDRNRILGSDCSSIVFFTYNKVDQTSINNTGNTPISKGTDGGGCIEVFFDSSKAQRRMFKLKATSFLSGSSFQYGSAVIRTSSKLTSSEQLALQDNIIAAFQKYPIVKDDNILENVSASSTQSSDIVDSSTNNLNEEWSVPNLEDFDYSYRNKGIILGKYHGKSTSIIIPDSYEVEGTVLPVLILDGTFSSKKDLINLVIPEGVIDIRGSALPRTDNLKSIYIPASLSGPGYFLRDFKNAEILYYGGNEDQWKRLRGSVIRSDLSFKKVILNSSIDDCISNINNVAFKNDEFLAESIYTPLSDFRYDIVNNEIILERYNGNSSFVNIAPEYYVDGDLRPVTMLGSTISNACVKTVIIPEGVRSVSTTTITTSAVKYLYIPSSLVDAPSGFWSRLKDIDTIYYAGSKDNFDTICTLDRWDIDVKHFIPEATISDVQFDN